MSIQLIWQLENFGIGNLARIKAQRAGVEGHHRPPQYPGHGGCRGDPGPGASPVGGGPGLQADRALRTGIITFNGTSKAWGRPGGSANVLVLISRPQEAVYSLELLNVAFDEYFSTVADYNRAQFELFHALGYPAREIAGSSPRRSPAGEHGAAGIPASGGQRAAAGHPLKIPLRRSDLQGRTAPGESCPRSIEGPHCGRRLSTRLRGPLDFSLVATTGTLAHRPWRRRVSVLLQRASRLSCS